MPLLLLIEEQYDQRLKGQKRGLHLKRRRLLKMAALSIVSSCTHSYSIKHQGTNAFLTEEGPYSEDIGLRKRSTDIV